MSKRASKSIAAQNTFSDSVEINGKGAISISGLSDTTATVQRMIDGTNWRDVESYTADQELVIDDIDCSYRVGVKTGDYGTDTVVVYIRSLT